MSLLRSQYANPHGFLGQLVGWSMLAENKERIAATLQVLNPQPYDHILEVGFGPGWAIQQLSEIVTCGFIAGIDISPVMLEQASKRNAASIQARQVELQLGPVNDIPFPEGSFTKALVINSLHHWPHPQTNGLAEVKRVLRPSGTLTLAEQPHNSDDALGLLGFKDKIWAMLEEVGFSNTYLRIKTIKGKPCLIFQAGNKLPVN